MNEKQCREIIKERSGGLCEKCGRAGKTIHHRRKRSAGGPWTPANCIMLCGDGVRGCHGWTEHNPNDARAIGLHVRSFEDESKVPVMWFGRPSLLRMDGTVFQDPDLDFSE